MLLIGVNDECQRPRDSVWHAQCAQGASNLKTMYKMHPLNVSLQKQWLSFSKSRINFQTLRD